MIVHTSSGAIEGFTENNMICFRGVPFAKAKRFQNAEPISWEGVLDCTEWGDMPPQKKGGLQNSFAGAPGTSEDCLNLNIATTSLDPERKLPIMIQIYGGAFTNGNNATPERCSPEIWLKDRDMIFVSINYRVNVFGFLYLKHIFGDGFEGNYGLSDQIAAIRWVHDNAAAFGGDPDRITVYGYSAGGKSVGALIAAPTAHNLFSQAICSSGGFQAIRTEETASVVADRYLEILGRRDKEYLLTVDADVLVDAFLQYEKRCMPTCLFGPVADGTLIPYSWIDHIASGDGWNGSIILGASRREMGIVKEHTETAAAADLFGANAEYAIKTYQKLAAGIEDPEELHETWIRILSDYMYRTHTDRSAEMLAAHGNAVWLFGTEMQPALHVMADYLIWTGGRKEKDPEAAGKLAQLVKEMYGSFVEHGVPTIDGNIWEPYSCTGQKLLLDKCISFRTMDDSDSLVDFPMSALCLHRM